jgi:Domain of unknown function (DUF1963)
VDDGRFRADVLARLRAQFPQDDDLVARIDAALRPVIGMRFAGDDAKVAPGASKTGGLPHVPAGFDWPVEEDTGDPLSLVCQIDLAEAASAAPGRLPLTGMLYLFSIADSDRAYGYEIDDSTTAVRYVPDPGPLTVAEAPEAFENGEYEGEGILPEKPLRVGASFILQAPDEDDDSDGPQAERFDYEVERAVEDAIEAAGGVPADVARMLGDAHMFRDEMREEYDPVRQILLLTLDGYATARYAFGEGTFHVLLDRDALAAGDPAKAEVVFEPGT